MSIYKLSDKIRAKLEKIGERTLKSFSDFEVKKCNSHLNQMCQEICEYTDNLESNYKFVANCILFDKNSNGLSLNGGCLWNVRKDMFIRVEKEFGDLVLIINFWIVSVE